MYYIEKYLVRILALLFSRCQVNGKGNIPREGPLLVVANHLSVGDPPILGVILGRRTIFMAKEDLFKGRLTGYFIRQFGAFPVYRGRLNREAIRQAAEVLKQGKALAMFPEGRRSESSGLQNAFFGSALIAYHNRVPILPVGITGTEKIRGFGWIRYRPKLSFIIGEPFYLPEANGPLTKEMLADFTSVIMSKIAELLPEKYRGEYGTRLPGISPLHSQVRTGGMRNLNVD